MQCDHSLESYSTVLPCVLTCFVIQCDPNVLDQTMRCEQSINSAERFCHVLLFVLWYSVVLTF